MQHPASAPAPGGARITQPEPPAPRRLHAVEPTRVAVVGLGYVGLPTSLALIDAGLGIIGIDISESRIADIRSRDVDLLDIDHVRLAEALSNPRFVLSGDPDSMAEADTILIAVPTPVHEDLRPDLRALEGACAMVVERARPGQTIILTSTSYVGTTRQLLVEPLARRGLEAGTDLCVAFSPERIDPGNDDHHQSSTPRVVGGHTHGCALAAAAVLAGSASEVHVVSSLEAAEMTKLVENTFRAVNIALAHEFADIALGFGLEPVEIVDAAATKPYGFMPFYPSAGVGGHCIPCDPHYLLQGVADAGGEAPLIERSMRSLADRPVEVAEGVANVLAADGVDIAGAQVLVVGAAYKPGIRDVRESPSTKIMDQLRARGAGVSFHDPLVPRIEAAGVATLESVGDPGAGDWDAVVITCVQPGMDLTWLSSCERVVDCTFRTPGGRTRTVL